MSNQIDVQRDSSDLWFAMVDLKVATDSTLSPIDKAVFCVLCVHVNWQKRDCWLKVETIAKEAGCSERSVQNSLKCLEERGIIERETRFSEGRQISSSYRIIGYKAKCYADEGCSICTPPRTTCTGGVQEVQTYNENPLTILKDSLTREAPLPDMPLAFENGKPVDSPQPEIPDNPEEIYTPEDAPDIMKSTAELFLLKTGHKGLTWDDISALRELAATQYPSRVQKEIDTAIKRFLKRGQSLSALTFGYIAGSLKHQPTRGRKSRAKFKPDPMSLTQTEIDTRQGKLTEDESLRELERLETEMREEGC